jgi:hypothetical protein
MDTARTATALGVAAVAGAALGLAQVAVAELAGVITLGAAFEAGNERVRGVQITLVAWYCAVAVPLAVAIAGARRGVGVPVRMAAVLPAAAATSTAYPLVARFSSDHLRHDAGTAVLTGILLGVVGAAAVAAAPAIGRGLAAHATLLWVAALALTPLVDPTVVYAGLVQPLGLDLLDRLWPPMVGLPYNLGYHLPTMLPVAVAVLVLAGVLGGRTARRTGAWAESVAAGAAGPVLAAVLYRLLPDQVYLWNETAGVVVVVLAACCLLTAAAAAAVSRRHAARPPATEAAPDRSP